MPATSGRRSKAGWLYERLYKGSGLLSRSVVRLAAGRRTSIRLPPLPLTAIHTLRELAIERDRFPALNELAVSHFALRTSTHHIVKYGAAAGD